MELYNLFGTRSDEEGTRGIYTQEINSKGGGFMMNNNDIKKLLSQNLEKEKYEHSVRVAETAHMLALRYRLDADKAYIAGLLHDCAKDMDAAILLEVAEEIGIELNEVQREKPLKFLHAKAGAYIAKKLYNISDHEILQAISLHHEGSVVMTSFDKVIALSDMIEPNRKFSDINELLRLLETDLDEAYFCAYKNIMVNYIRLNLFLEDSRTKVYNHLLLERLSQENDRKELSNVNS